MNFHPLSIGILTACVVIYAECLAQPLKIADDGRKEAQLQLGARISAPRSRSDQDLPLPPKRPGQLGTYDLLAPGKRLKAGRRTIAFLDDFEQAYALPILGKSRVAHGEISATAAEQNGFNVLRLQLNHKAIRWEYSADYSKVLTSIYDNVLAGNLKLKRGDIINISMGQPFQGLFGQPSFAEASDLLRLREPITAKNINDRAKQSEVLAALRAKLQEAELSKQLHERLRQVVETNEIIAKIQDRLGVQVVVAAGNNGPQRFSWDFLTASERLASTDATGALLAGSATGTAAGQGQFRVFYHSLDLLSAKPVAQSLGFYTLAGTPVRYESIAMDGASQGLAIDLSGATTACALSTFKPASGESTGFTQDEPGPVHLAQTRALSSQQLETELKRLSQAVPVGWLEGTSFVNVVWYPRHKSLKR